MSVDARTVLEETKSALLKLRADFPELEADIDDALDDVSQLLKREDYA